MEFSRQSNEYLKYRPGYPTAMFEFILRYVKKRMLAWDVGTGNGQSASQLANYFDLVYATDTSPQQLDKAQQGPNIQYATEPAEHSSLKAGTVNLVTIAQALHWFDLEAFYEEVRRVAAPGAIIAAWTYTLIRINDVLDPLIDDYHFNIMGPYWDSQRKFVDDRYENIPFPFRLLKAPPFEIRLHWSLEELEGYFKTWSALQHYKKNNTGDPVATLMQNIQQQAGGKTDFDIRFPLYLKLGYVN